MIGAGIALTAVAGLALNLAGLEPLPAALIAAAGFIAAGFVGPFARRGG